MNPTRLTAALLLALTAAALTAGPAHADTIAQENPPVILAQDTTPAPATIPAVVIGIDADIVGGLTVTGHQGRKVTARARNHATRSITVAPAQAAILKGLAPGVRYAISVGGHKVATAVPLAQVGRAHSLRVQTTDTPGTVEIAWSHTITKHEGTSVTFDVTAAPLNADGTVSADTVTATSTRTASTLTGLDTDALYRFTVTPRNSASTGRASTATMARTLADITGTPKAVPPPTIPAPASPTPTAAPGSAPAAASSPAAPAPAPAPATKTIYVCPDGYPETAAGTCQKTLAYTYSDVTTTSPYTYTQETRNGGACSYLPNPSAPGGYDIYCPTYTVDVKNAPPSGWTDNGSSYTRTVTTKDPTPAGYTDTGTQWIATTAKTAQVVPA